MQKLEFREIQPAIIEMIKGESFVAGLQDIRSACELLGPFAIIDHADHDRNRLIGIVDG